MKTIFSLWVWFCYCCISIFYFVSYGSIEPMYSKILYFSATIVVLTYCCFCLFNKVNGYCSYFSSLSLTAVTVNMSLILLYHLFSLESFVFKICSFLSFELISAIFILYSGNKNGLFKNEG